VDTEPMPIKFNLVSICNHPVFSNSRSVCEASANSYCEEYLSKTKEGVSCTPAPEAECLWDTDCGEKHACMEGSCQKQPDCSVYIHKSCSCEDKKPIVYGPLWRPQEDFTGFKKAVAGTNSKDFCCAKVTGGCEEIIFVDDDELFDDQRNFKSDNTNNLIVENRYSNALVRTPAVPGDLQDDLWAMNILPKMKWLSLGDAKLSCETSGLRCLDGLNLWNCKHKGATPELVEWCNDGCTATPLTKAALGWEPDDFCSIKCPTGNVWGGDGDYCLGNIESNDGYLDGMIYGCGGEPGSYALYLHHWCGTKGCRVAPAGQADSCCQGSEPFTWGARMWSSSNDKCPRTKARSDGEMPIPPRR